MSNVKTIAQTPLTPHCKWEIRANPSTICSNNALYIYVEQVYTTGCPPCSADHSGSYPQYYKIEGVGPINSSYSNPSYTWTDPYNQFNCNGFGMYFYPPLNPGTYTVYASQYSDFSVITDQITITVYGEESLSFTSSFSQSTNCDGLGVIVSLTSSPVMNPTSISVTLHAPSPAYDQTWSMNNYFNHNFSISMWGNYVVENEISNACYDSIHYDTLTIGPNPYFTTSGNFCLGGAINLFGQAHNCISQIQNWQWNFGDGTNGTGQNISHSYQNSGTYNVTLTVTGSNPSLQTNTIVQQVTVNPLPDKPIISGYFNTCHGLTTYTITNHDQNFTYYYNINYGGTQVPFTSNQFNINWASYPNGGVLYVTTTDTNGCSATDSLKVFGCCDVNHGGLLPRYQDTTFTAAPSAGSFVINGILTIDGTFSLNTKFIYFGPNAKIIVNPSRTLTISNSSLSVGCDTMWDGIYLNFANSGLIVNNSNIRDAKNAIVSNACAVYSITNSTLNNNYRNIVVQSCSGTNNSTIASSTLTCTSTLKPQYPPVTASRTYSGIEINDIGNITVGNTASAAYRNYFNNMDFGIKNYCSNLEVYNNSFQNMTSSSLSYPPSSGVGIISTAGKFTPKNLTVGGISNGTFNSNKFESCFWGVYADYYQNVTIQRDTFNSTGSWTSIYLYSHPAKTIKILNNVITDGIIGIHNGHCFNSTIDINYNRITNNYYGIAALNVNPATVQKLNIYNNYIWNNTYGNGIQVTNIQGVAGSNTQRANISNNFVYINNPDLNNVQGSNGIFVNQSPYSLIQLNSVSRSSGTVADSTQAKRLNGIHVQLSPNSKLCQNTVSRMGCGLRFNGTMANTTLQLNNMLNYYFYGVRLDNAFIGNQGDTANCIAWRNRWNISSSLIRIQGTASIQHKWLFDGAYNTNNLYYPSPNSVTYPLLLQNCPNYVTSCSETLPLSALAFYAPVVENTNNYTIYPEENRYWDKHFFYYDIQNSSVLASNLSTDAHALSFYNMLDANNIGDFAKVNAYMNNEDYAAAEAINNSITPHNDIEKNRQIVNGIYLGTWAKGRFEFTADERSVLEAIAYLEPLTGGSGVYSARVMLGINPPVVTGSNKKAVQQNNAQNHIGAIYPNPANDVACLDYSLADGHKAHIYFYNMMGTFIESFTINSSENRFEFSTKNFKSGLYFYKIVLDNSKLLESNKLIIIK